MIQPRTNSDCFPWCCKDCHVSGVVTVDQPTMPGDLTARILELHKALAAHRCLGTIMLAPAENWYDLVPRSSRAGR